MGDERRPNMQCTFVRFFLFIVDAMRQRLYFNWSYKMGLPEIRLQIHHSSVSNRMQFDLRPQEVFFRVSVIGVAIIVNENDIRLTEMTLVQQYHIHRQN